MTKVHRTTMFSPPMLRAVMATTSAFLASISLSVPAAAGTTPEVVLSPPTLPLTNQYLTTSHDLAGQAAVVTVTVGPNKVLLPGYPVEVQECDANPVSSGDCDALTTLTFDQLTKKPVSANSNGSVTVHFLVWSPLPNKWDPYSVIKVGPGHPVALWIGDDPSHWATMGLVSPPLVVTKTALEPSPAAVGPGSGASLAAGSPPRSSSTGWLVALLLTAFGLGAGFALVIGRRRRRNLAS